jgi:hypothetical protein
MIIKIKRNFDSKQPKHLDTKRKLTFAWLPIYLDDYILWLGFYYKIFMWNEWEDCWKEHFPQALKYKNTKS